MLKRHGKLLRYSKDIQIPDGDGKSLFFFFLAGREGCMVVVEIAGIII